MTMQNQPLDEKQLHALLRLKRYEAPPPGYFDGLLDRIHRRQREELLRRPAWHIAIDRIRAYLMPMRVDWGHAASMAALLVAGVFAIRVAIPEQAAGGTQLAGGFEASRVATAAQAGPVLTLQPGLAPALTSRAEREHVNPNPDAPTRFVIDIQPASYEASQIRF